MGNGSHLRDMMNRLDAIRSEISDIDQQVAALKARQKEIKDSAEREVIAHLAKSPDKQSEQECATYAYWIYRDVLSASAIAQFYKVHVNSLLKLLHPVSITVACRICGNHRDLIIKSRAEYDSWKSLGFSGGVCEECDQRIKQQEEAKLKAARELLFQLKTMPYAEYLKTEHWQEVRKRMLKRAGGRCQVCNRAGVSLHVHHRTYERRGQEEYGDLIVLCADCHRTFHENGKVAS